VKKLVFFASGSGSNFQSVIDAIENNEISASVSGLITDNYEAGALRRAREKNIPTAVIPFSPGEDFSKQMNQQLEKWNPDLIVLAGYLKKIPDSIVESFHNRIINIHPSLLPKYGGKGFYGRNVHQAVIEAGDTRSGCTVHFVNSEYDRGSIIKQIEVPVFPDDTPESLGKRVLKEEHKLLPNVITQLIK
jgi:formyltetrahydrofolate-dependent phosphoribosylglycinamide formyltransferase